MLDQEPVAPDTRLRFPVQFTGEQFGDSEKCVGFFPALNPDYS
jgi:hypothetical protein